MSEAADTFTFRKRPKHLTCEVCQSTPLCGVSNAAKTRFFCAFHELSGQAMQAERLPVGARVEFTVAVFGRIPSSLVDRSGAVTTHDPHGIRVTLDGEDMPVLVRWEVCETLEVLNG